MKAHAPDSARTAQQPQGSHSAGAARGELAQLVASSPYVVVQRQRLQGMFGEALQLEGGSDEGPTFHQRARSGVQGSGGALPHLDRIQKSFGRHDVSQVQAYRGANAAQASRSIGAEAYAMGDRVAFAQSSPSLHTAAHEAAHTIQQRSGLRLEKGVGQVGDPYERHADAVADRVVQGKSAEDLLDRFQQTAHPPGVSTRMDAPVQRLIGVEAELHVPAFADGGAVTDDQKIRAFLGGGLKYGTGLAPVAGGNDFKKEADHDVISATLEGMRQVVNGLLQTAGKAPIAKPANKIAIIEYITDPPAHAFDETTAAGRKALKNCVAGMVQDMNATLKAAKVGVTAFGGGHSYGVYPQAVWDGFAAHNGLNQQALRNSHLTALNNIDSNLGVQVSAGIVPKGLTKFLKKVGEDASLTGNFKANNAPGGNPAPWIRLVTRDAASVADSIVSHIDTGVLVHHWYGASTPLASSEIRNSKSLKGFVSLIVAEVFAMFLARRAWQGGNPLLTKNVVAMLPRTPLTEVLRELDVAKRPDQWPAPQRNSLINQIVTRAALRLAQAPVNRAGGEPDNFAEAGGGTWQQWVSDMVSNPGGADAFFNHLGGMTQVDPHDHPSSKQIVPVLGAGAGIDHPRPQKDAKGVPIKKAKSGAVVSELRWIRDVQPGGLMALVDNVVGKVRDSN